MACRPPTGYWRQVVVNHTRRHHRGAIPTVNLTPKGVYRHETVYTKQGLFKGNYPVYCSYVRLYSTIS